MYKSLLPALIVGSALVGNVSYAEPVPYPSQTAQQTEQLTPNNGIPAQSYDYQTTLQQLSSIQQLRDVSPTDWSYEALRNLVENYGCIVGYPDRTYRGDRALTRNEFAAGLNACMEQLERRLLEARNMGSAAYQNTAPEIQAIPTDRGEHFTHVIDRAFYNESLRFYDNTDMFGQMNKIFGWRYAPGSFFDNTIANDAKTIEAVLWDGLRQQTAGPRIRTPDLVNPFNSSLSGNPDYIRTQPPTIRDRQFEQQRIPIIPQ
ncbi:iron uptake porin [Crocosphaera sp. Alani8]|uniref:iron uptake porin n=1 Tax=Crocosphaera sp. Alani8 TaxID=3038952 RepID=UPI00313DF260